MPRSPWLASPGCTKNAGVPVEARVAAILRPMCPDLPMPLTTTRPLQPRISRQASTKAGPIRASSASTAAASVAITVRALRVMASGLRSIGAGGAMRAFMGAR